MSLLGIYGAAGFGREIFPFVRQKANQNDSIVFIDDNIVQEAVNGCSIVRVSEFFQNLTIEKYVSIAIANPQIRKNLDQEITKNGIRPLNVLGPFVSILDEVEIKDGHTLCGHVMITSNVKIGRCFHANMNSYVAHDCVIGDYVTFAPGVKCNGNVVIEDEVYVGTGAVIKQGTPDEPIVIGKGSFIGMGALVTKCIPPGSFVKPPRSEITVNRVS